MTERVYRYFALACLVLCSCDREEKAPAAESAPPESPPTSIAPSAPPAHAAPEPATAPSANEEEDDPAPVLVPNPAPDLVSQVEHQRCMAGDSKKCLEIGRRLGPGPAVTYTNLACYQGLQEGCAETCKIDPAECD